MSGELATFDPSKLMDSVRDRIKAEFVGLIPEDAWKQMVAAEVKKFLEPEPNRFGYGSERPTPSGFQRVVWDELEKATRARLKIFLESDEWRGRWDGQGKVEASDAVRKIVVDKSGEILAGILGGAIQQTIEAMRSRI